MARSFGDYVAASVGVVSIPEIKKHSIRAQDKFIVIASDGIWE
jgi:serine/threonine protein phosphatase PrpC